MSDEPNTPMPETVDATVEHDQVAENLDEFVRKVEVNERILSELQSFELKLLDAGSLAALMDILLDDSREHFQLDGVELWLFDPDQQVLDLLPDDIEYKGRVRLLQDSHECRQFYNDSLTITFASIENDYFSRIFFADEGMVSAVMLPLVRDGNLVGSLHFGSRDINRFEETKATELFGHLAAIVAICFDNCVNQERLSQLSLVDALTRISNRRAFKIELAKEISRAHRSRGALSVLFLNLDSFEDINETYGHSSGDHMIKAVSINTQKLLRGTDHIARFEGDGFAIMLPGCGEREAQEIAERIRAEIEALEIDDGRGANLYVTASVGLCTWYPEHYPAVNMEQLGAQLVTSAQQALGRAKTSGRNQIATRRLTTFVV
jgi:two-component system, cell cycle response regulator